MTQLEKMQKEIENLTSKNDVLEAEKSQNIVSIEEIVGDNNNLKTLLSE